MDNYYNSNPNPNQMLYPQNNFQPNIQPPKPKQTFSGLDLVFAILSLVLGFVFTKFVLFRFVGFISTAFFIAMLICAAIFISKKGYKISKGKKVFLGILIFFSLSFSITDNDFIKFLVSAFIIISGVYWVFSTCRSLPLSKAAVANVFVAIFAVPFSRFGACPMAIFQRREKSRSKNFLFAVIGILCGIPLTCFVAILLMSADENMARILHDFFGDILEHIFENVFIFILSVPVSFYIFGMLYANTKAEKMNGVTTQGFSKGTSSVKFVPNAFTYAFVTPVCILYALYFVLQIQYFVSAFLNILPKDFTYAEYARRGFFELFVVCVINALLLLAINIFTKNSGEKTTTVMKLFNFIISLFTLVIITTALSKMIMYISVYGLTQLRLYTSWFMVLMALCFLGVILKQFAHKLSLAKTFSAVFVVMFALLAFSCPDAIIAKTNIEMYKQGYTSELDVYTLTSLSDDAWVVILDNDDLFQRYKPTRPKNRDYYDDYDYYDYYDYSPYSYSYDSEKSSKKNSFYDIYDRMNIPSIIVYSKLQAQK